MVRAHVLNKAAVTDDLHQRKQADVHPPYYYHVHLHMPCNQKCIMCKPDGRHPKDFISIEQFEQFLDQVEPYAEHMTLIGGETLLYPWINEAIDLLVERQLAVSISTNATMLDEPLIERLLTLRELNLRCSIDAATRETYRRIRGTDSFERATANMRLFGNMAKHSALHRQILVYVVMRENLDEVLPFIEFAQTLMPDELQFHPVRHVDGWDVDNGTGWQFVAAEQQCEVFKDRFNRVMAAASARCSEIDLKHEAMQLS